MDPEYRGRHSPTHDTCASHRRAAPPAPPRVSSLHLPIQRQRRFRLPSRRALWRVGCGSARFLVRVYTVPLRSGGRRAGTPGRAPERSAGFARYSASFYVVRGVVGVRACNRAPCVSFVVALVWPRSVGRAWDRTVRIMVRIEPLATSMTRNFVSHDATTQASDAATLSFPLGTAF